MSYLTSIDLPHAVADEVNDILIGAGFTVGTIGGGYCSFERVGTKITENEMKRLVDEMAGALFQFEYEDLDDNEL